MWNGYYKEFKKVKMFLQSLNTEEDFLTKISDDTNKINSTIEEKCGLSVPLSSLDMYITNKIIPEEVIKIGDANTINEVIKEIQMIIKKEGCFYRHEKEIKIKLDKIQEFYNYVNFQNMKENIYPSISVLASIISIVALIISLIK